MTWPKLSVKKMKLLGRFEVSLEYFAVPESKEGSQHGDITHVIFLLSGKLKGRE